MTQYNALMSLKLQQESGETIKEENVRNALNTDKPQQLDKFAAEARKRGILSKKLEESLRMVLKTREWILHECVYDHHLSFRKHNSKQYFFGIIDAYIKDTKSIKIGLLNEIETWLKQKGYDLNQVYQILGELPENRE